MTLVKVVLGLFGLGIVVFIHELGHFLAARLSGIDVEAFSIGWGKPILKKKIGTVEYRLGLFPLGGYCKMRGDNDYQETWENKKNGIEPPEGSFFAAHPLKRVFTAFAGPLFNFLFAVIVLSAILGRGTEFETLENRIVLLKEIDNQSHPADQAGLLTGDRITAIAGNPTNNFRDIMENITLNPDKDIPVTVLRDNVEVNLTIRPVLDSSGAGKIGVYSWTTPYVKTIKSGGAAEKAGLREGDLLLAVNGTELPYTVAMLKIFSVSKPESFTVEYERDGEIQTAVFNNVLYSSNNPDLGIEFPVITVKTPSLPPWSALYSGSREAVKTLIISVKSLGLLFKKGIDLTQAVSGPARITYMMGDVAAGGFSESVGTGFSSLMGFLALISIALCIMNLLPLPIIDGGMIILYMAEMVSRKPIHPRAVSVFQTIGIVIIFSLMIFAIFNDILFFTSR